MEAAETPWAHEKSWREVREYLDSGNDMAILPVGSVEQHGPHMPIGHDALAAHHVAQDAGRRAGILVYPTLWYGWTNNHMALTGTVTLKPETLTAVVTDIMSSLLYHGFNRVIIVNGHRRANLAPLEIAVNQMRQKTGAVLAIVDVGIIAFDRIADIRTTPPGGQGHACELEASHALHMYPHLVDMEEATPKNSNPNPEWMTSHHINDPGVDAPRFFYPKTVAEYRAEIGDEGQSGDPTQATPEKGRAFHEAVVERLIGVIEYLKTREVNVHHRPAPFED